MSNYNETYKVYSASETFIWGKECHMRMSPFLNWFFFLEIQIPAPCICHFFNEFAIFIHLPSIKMIFLGFWVITSYNTYHPWFSATIPNSHCCKSLNITNTRYLVCYISSEKLKVRLAADYFSQISSWLEMWWNSTSSLREWRNIISKIYAWNNLVLTW